MCLAVPAQVIEILDGQKALVTHQNVERVISIEFTPNVKINDYVVLHVGLAISILDPEEANATLDLFKEDK